MAGKAKPQVLIAEDEISIAEVLKTALEAEGFSTRHVTTGAEALKAIAESVPDLAVFDIGLPDQTGIEVLKTARRTLPDFPVLFLTARTSEVDRVLGLELGADDYVSKPFSPREVVARIRAILRRTNQERIARDGVNGDGLIIDDVRKRVTVGGTSPTLSHQEFKVLLALAGRPGKVFSREEPMDRAWEEPGMSTDRAIDTHIKTLRAKIGADWVQTHRGVGYALRDDMPVKVIRT